jgi:hypothetical protein
MLGDFTIEALSLPPIIRFLPEIASAILTVYVLVAGTRNRFQLVAPKYWLVFGAMALVILCGIVINNPGSGPLISGMRFYLRAVPMFFVPAVLPMSEEKLKGQLKLLLGLALLQLPVAGYQRWVVLSQGRYSGDAVQGTLTDSGILSMFLICAALVLTGFMLKRRIRAVWFLVVFLLLLFPTTINETKVTVILLPFGLLTTLILGADKGKRLRYAGIALTLLVAFGAIFVPMYNKLEQGDPYKVDILDFFTNEKELNQYLVTKNVHKVKVARRGDAIIVPMNYLTRDPLLLTFGVGLGNASPSTLGRNFEGSYYSLFQSVLIVSFSFFILELGILGVSLIAALFWMVFSDTLYVAHRDSTLTGALAAGWIGVVAVFLIAAFYTVFQYFTSITYLYWYFSGVICARAMSMRRETPGVPVPAVQPRLNQRSIGATSRTSS